MQLSKRERNFKKIQGIKPGKTIIVLDKTKKDAPPNFSPQMIRPMRVRTQATGAASFIGIITVAQLSALNGLVAASATTSFLLSALIKLRRIEIWSPVATAGTSITCSLSWVNMSQDFESPPKTFSDSSVSFDHPAHLNELTPRGELVSKWHGGSLADNMVQLIAPPGSIIDFYFDWVLNDVGFTYVPVAGPALIGATAGTFYHHPISGTTSGTLQPLTVNAL